MTRIELNPDQPLTPDEKFIIALNKVSTTTAMLLVVFVGWATNHWWSMILIVACAGVTAIAEITYLIWKQTGIDNFNQAATGLAMTSWILGLAAGVMLI